MPQTQQQAPATQQTPQTSTTGQSVQSQIQGALQQQPELSNVMVNATSDKIELSGTVASKADKEKARRIAESNAGGRKVVDKIKVSGSTTTSPTTPRPPR